MCLREAERKYPKSNTSARITTRTSQPSSRALLKQGRQSECMYLRRSRDLPRAAQHSQTHFLAPVTRHVRHHARAAHPRLRLLSYASSQQASALPHEGWRSVPCRAWCGFALCVWALSWGILFSVASVKMWSRYEVWELRGRFRRYFHCSVVRLSALSLSAVLVYFAWWLRALCMRGVGSGCLLNATFCNRPRICIAKYTLRCDMTEIQHRRCVLQVNVLSWMVRYLNRVERTLCV